MQNLRVTTEDMNDWLVIEDEFGYFAFDAMIGEFEQFLNFEAPLFGHEVPEGVKTVDEE
jgi:hypothetical protein